MIFYTRLKVLYNTRLKVLFVEMYVHVFFVKLFVQGSEFNLC